MASFTPGSGRIDVRASLRRRWLNYWIVAGFSLGVPAGVLIYASMGQVIIAPALATILVLTVIGPRHLAPQRVELNDRGLAVVRESLAWAQGGTAFVPWEDVHLVVPGTTKENPPRNSLEMYLVGTDRIEAPVVGWATLVPAGATWRRAATSRARMVLELDDRSHGLLDAEIGVWRPRVHASAEPAPPVSAAQVPAEGTALTSASSSSSSREVILPWRDAAGWFVATGLCLFMGVGALVVAAVTAFLGQADVAGAMLIVGLLLALAFRPLLRMAPRYRARQGIVLDDRGITLVRHQRGRLPALLTEIPWSQVLHVSHRVVRSRRSKYTDYYVDMRLKELPARVELPHWAYLHEEELQLDLGFSGYTAVRNTIRTIRPELFRQA